MKAFGKASFALLAILVAKLAMDFSAIEHDFDDPVTYKALFVTLTLFGSIVILEQAHTWFDLDVDRLLRLSRRTWPTISI